MSSSKYSIIIIDTDTIVGGTSGSREAETACRPAEGSGANLGHDTYYHYDPLPSATSIRLLEVLPSSEAGNICCSLRTFDLENDCPVYDALSYTWGNPITIYERPDQEPILPTAEDVIRQSRSENNGPSSAGGEGETATGSSPSMVIDLEAVLYRSRHPHVPFEKLDWDTSTERRCAISCNGGRKILVTENCLEALNFLRRIVVGDNAVPGDMFQRLCGKTRALYIWIDAICINQDDLLERNAQVAIMSRIFGQAQIVLGWLGKGDGLSKTALHTVAQLCSRICEDANSGHGKSFTGSIYEFSDFDESNWLAVFALLQRLWFRRAWIVQEAVFAQELILVCGSNVFLWSLLEEVLCFLSKTKLDQDITALAKAFMAGGPSGSLTRKLQRAGVVMTGFAASRQTEPLAAKELKVDPAASYGFAAGIRSTRTSLGMDHVKIAMPQESGITQLISRIGNKISGMITGQERVPGDWTPAGMTAKKVKLTEDPASVSLISLLARFRSCHSSDPRDKVFALLAIASKTNATLPVGVKIIEPDYRQPVADVYTAAAEFILQSTSRLKLLSQVQDPSLTCIQGLPSWIPDFSVALGRESFEPTDDSYWSASGAVLGPSFQLQPRNKLVVDGVLVDTVSGVAASNGCYFVRTAKLVLETPVWYLGRDTLMLDLNLDPLEKSRAPVMLPIDRVTYVSWKERVGKSPKALLRTEAYWRTLVADSFDGVHPAPICCGFAFADWLCLKLMRARHLVEAVNRFEATDNGGEGLTNVERKLEEKVSAWSLLNVAEPGGFYTLEAWREMTKKLKKMYGKLGSPEFEGKILKGSSFDPEAGGMRFLPDRERLLSFVEGQEKDIAENPQGIIESSRGF